MTQLELSRDLLRRVSPSDARSYAKARGWGRVSGVQGPYAVFHPAGDDLDQILVPDNPRTADFADRIRDVILKLSEIEKRDPEAVLSDVLNHDADVLRFRVVSEEAKRGTLALAEAAAMLEGVRRTVLSAAHSVLRPQHYHPRLSRREADQLLRSCRFEQTERGSFVFALSCPLKNSDPPATLFTNGDPFPRATTRYMMRSLALLAESIRHDDLRAATHGETAVISANLCDGLLRMRPEGTNSMLEVGISWAPSKPLEDGEHIDSRVHFEIDDFDLIEHVYLQLRPQSDPEHDVFVATVDELRGIMNDEGVREGDVTLSLYSRESDEIVSARAELRAEWYTKAHEAHMHGSYVIVKGVLHRGSRVSRLSEVGLFEILKNQNA